MPYIRRIRSGSRQIISEEGVVLKMDIRLDALPVKKVLSVFASPLGKRAEMLPSQQFQLNDTASLEQKKISQKMSQCANNIMA